MEVLALALAAGVCLLFFVITLVMRSQVASSNHTVLREALSAANTDYYPSFLVGAVRLVHELESSDGMTGTRADFTTAVADALQIGHFEHRLGQRLSTFKPKPADADQMERVVSKADELFERRERLRGSLRSCKANALGAAGGWFLATVCFAGGAFLTYNNGPATNVLLNAAMLYGGTATLIAAVCFWKSIRSVHQFQDHCEEVGVIAETKSRVLFGLITRVPGIGKP